MARRSHEISTNTQQEIGMGVEVGLGVTTTLKLAQGSSRRKVEVENVLLIICAHLRATLYSIVVVPIRYPHFPKETAMLPMSSGSNSHITHVLRKKQSGQPHRILGIGVIFFGIWMGVHHDQCRRSLTLPVMGLGASILLISFIGFLGAWKNVVVFLWVYLVMLCLILIAIMVSTVLAFIITNSGSGHAVNGLRYKEYHLQDYSPWFLKQLNDSKHWRHLRSCLVKSEECNSLPKRFKTLKEYKLAELTPIEAGCCRPPSEAGVAQYMKMEWRIVAIFNVILFVVLSFVYFIGCCARRNVSRIHTPKIPRRR
ncbi:hypothetical protein ZIOFF_054113 [Zingiber officinale]|uniref:Uncharacterized protein n=1 Tax=Zingiber officinale TaxID=94328 RepID=A0A8J5KJ62_ZINOF|nr:hypothetical protein ZIOFF_054113 [Zingiber officinale]